MVDTGGRTIRNPYRPGAGHMPPYLAGREPERREFYRLLDQDIILENLVLTGLRGVGKTVLLDTFKPMAIDHGWLWAGTDMSESTSVSEDSVSLRLITDLAVVTSSMPMSERVVESVGFVPAKKVETITLNYNTLAQIYNETPGMASDKLKAVLELTWEVMEDHDRRGIVFAYDEAQNLTDHAAKDQYPLSLLLDVFQSIQKKGVRFMLALTGLPTLFPKLVEARTFAERMFRVVFLDKLSKGDSEDAIKKPVNNEDSLIIFDDASVNSIYSTSGGYPYFIQFICREAYDIIIQKLSTGEPMQASMDDIVRKLDTDFFAGRWGRATDRQRELLIVIAQLETSESEFTVQEVAEKSKAVLEKSFSPSHANQMLSTLSECGLIYKNRHGRYSFAVPLLGKFILRQCGLDQEKPA